MTHNLPLAGRTFLVTGPAKGMGGAISLAIAEAGGDLVLVGRDVDAIERVAVQAREHGRAVLVHRADITEEAEMLAAVAAADNAFPTGLAGAVSIAGIFGPSGRKLWEYTTEEFHQLFDVNVLGTFLLMKTVLPRLIERGSGSVVNIGGTFGFKGVRNAALYGATKWTLRGLTKSAALEAGVHGVRVNMVSPGGVDGPRLTTELEAEAERDGISFEAAYHRFANLSALRRMSTADDIAQAVVFLLSDRARNITGQDLIVDGGTIV